MNLALKLDHLSKSIQELHSRSTNRPKRVKIDKPLSNINIIPSTHSTSPIQIQKEDVSCDAMEYNIDEPMLVAGTAQLEDIDTQTSDPAIKIPFIIDSIHNSFNEPLNIELQIPEPVILNTPNTVQNDSNLIGLKVQSERTKINSITAETGISSGLLNSISKVRSQSTPVDTKSMKQPSSGVQQKNSKNSSNALAKLLQKVPAQKVKEVIQRTPIISTPVKAVQNTPISIHAEFIETKSYLSISSHSSTSTISIKKSKIREVQYSNTPSPNTQFNLLKQNAIIQSSLATHSAELLHAQTLKNFDNQKVLLSQQIDWQVHFIE